MADINAQMVARLKRGDPVKVFIQPNSYYKGDSNETQRAIDKVNALARSAGVEVKVEVVTGDDGPRCAIGIPLR